MLANPQEKAVDRPVMTRRLHVPIMVVVAMLAIACSRDLGDGPGASRRVHEAVTPETSSRHPAPSPRPYNVVVTMHGGGWKGGLGQASDLVPRDVF